MLTVRLSWQTLNVELERKTNVSFRIFASLEGNVFTESNEFQTKQRISVNFSFPRRVRFHGNDKLNDPLPNNS